MKKPSLCFMRTVCILLALLLLSALLSACGPSVSSSRPETEKNQGDNKLDYPYLVHTASSTWYLAAADLELLGEDAYYAGLYEILENLELDFADAREALKGYIPEEIPPIDIYTDFCEKGAITELTDAYYHNEDNNIKLLIGWRDAGKALLHEYVHYLTQHCTEQPATFGFYAEGIAEYISKLVCKNRMARRVNMVFSEEELLLLKAHGAWDEAEDCIDLVKTYYGQAEFFAQGRGVGIEVYTVTNTTEPRTEEMQQNLTVNTVSHFEAACILAYLVETDSMDTVMKSLSTDPEEIETIYGVPFSEIYRNWAVWNAKKCAELGIN